MVYQGIRPQLLIQICPSGAEGQRVLFAAQIVKLLRAHL